MLTLAFDAVLFGIAWLAAGKLNRSKNLRAFGAASYIVLNYAAVFLALNNTSLNLKTVDNFNQLMQGIKQQDTGSANLEILYFNDKYIFIEVGRHSQKTILIKKTGYCI